MVNSYFNYRHDSIVLVSFQSSNYSNIDNNQIFFFIYSDKYEYSDDETDNDNNINSNNDDNNDK